MEVFGTDIATGLAAHHTGNLGQRGKCSVNGLIWGLERKQEEETKEEETKEEETKEEETKVSGTIVVSGRLQNRHLLETW